MRNVCVYAGSSQAAREERKREAAALGRELARREVGVVYGGGRLGLMGALADGALAEGGRVTGIIPDFMKEKELAHPSLTELRVVRTMHERKAAMAAAADAFIALPGGIGTLEEFAEVLTWAQLGLHRKPCGLLNGDGYFDPLLAFFDRMVEERFLKPAHRGMIVAGRDPGGLLDRLAAHRPPDAVKWPDPSPEAEAGERR